MNITEFYRALLRDVLISDNEGDGYLSAHYKDTKTALTVEGKRLVLPTNDILRNAAWDSHIAFHPMSENITRGESPVLKALKDYIWLRLTNVLSSLALDLMKTAATPATHKKLGGPDVAKYLQKIGTVDETTFKNLDKVLRACSKNPSKRLVTIYLKHGSKGDEGFARQAMVSFPIMDEFDAGTEDDKIFDVKIRSKDKVAIKNLFEYILGDEETRKMYSYGTNNLDAPYFHALLTSFYKLASRLNHLVDLHKKHLSEPEAMRFELAWAPGLEDFSLYRGVIPSQKGNEGDSEVATEGQRKPDLQEQAAAIFSRPATKRPDDVPWDEERRHGGDRRVGEERREVDRHPKGTIGIEQFRAQFAGEQRREEREYRGGFDRFHDDRRGDRRDDRSHGFDRYGRREERWDRYGAREDRGRGGHL